MIFRKMSTKQNTEVELSAIVSLNLSESLEPSKRQDRNLWWKALRETILKAHSIHILGKPSLKRLPRSFFQILDQRCQNLRRHESRAKTFHTAVSTGKGLEPSGTFTNDIILALEGNTLSVQGTDPKFDRFIIPPQRTSATASYRSEIPTPQPNVAYGFSADNFSSKELQQLPTWLAATCTVSDSVTEKSHSSQVLYCPYLVINRPTGGSIHEIQSALNYCAIDGSSALRAMTLLFETALPKRSTSSSTAFVFSIVIDNDLAVINQHWTNKAGDFYTAPLRKFELCNKDHTMLFLAWVEAIQMWAEICLLPQIRCSLQKILSQLERVAEKNSGLENTERQFAELGDQFRRTEVLSPPLSPITFLNTPNTPSSTNFKIPLSITGRMRCSSQTSTATTHSAEEMPWNDIHPALRKPSKCQDARRSNTSTLPLIASCCEPSLISGSSKSQTSDNSSLRSEHFPHKTDTPEHLWSPCMRSVKSPTLDTITSERSSSARTCKLHKQPVMEMKDTSRLRRPKSRSCDDGEPLKQDSFWDSTSPINSTNGSFGISRQGHQSTPELYRFQAEHHHASYVNMLEAGIPNFENYGTNRLDKSSPSPLPLSIVIPASDSFASVCNTAGLRSQEVRKSQILNVNIRTVAQSPIQGSSTELELIQSQSLKSTPSSVSDATARINPIIRKPKGKEPSWRRHSCPIQSYITKRKDRKMNASVGIPVETTSKATTLKSKIGQGLSVIVDHTKPKTAKREEPASSIEHSASNNSQSPCDDQFFKKQSLNINLQRMSAAPAMNEAWIDHVLSERVVCADNKAEHIHDFRFDSGFKYVDSNNPLQYPRPYANHARSLSSPTRCGSPLRYAIAVM